jgi:AcrR family transcriptional regulator
MRSGRREHEIIMAANHKLLSEIESAQLRDKEEHSAMERLILKHAMRSFGRRGYAATSLRSIAAEAGVTAPMVSYYFKSKEGLFQRIAEIVMSSLESEMKAAMESSSSFYDAVQAIARGHVELAERSPAAVEFMFSMLYGPKEGQPTPDIESMYASTRSIIAEAFARGIGSGEFLPRPGMTVGFLVEQLGSLLHDHVSRKFRIDRMIEQFPEKRVDIEARSGEWSLELALAHFFHGAGPVSDLDPT